jgi:hypothetical protein
MAPVKMAGGVGWLVAHFSDCRQLTVTSSKTKIEVRHRRRASDSPSTAFTSRMLQTAATH